MRRNLTCTQEETFKVLSGKFGYFWENETRSAEVGQSLSIPAGIKHSFFSADPEQPLEFEVTLKPAVRVGSNASAPFHCIVDELPHSHGWRQVNMYRSMPWA